MGMSGVKLSDDVVAEIVRRTKAGESQSTIAKALGIAESSVSRHQKLQGVSSALPIGKETVQPERDYEECGDRAKVTVHTPERVQSEEDAVRVCKVDLTRWFVDKVRIKAYQGFMKDERTNEPVVTQMFSVTLDLKRVAPKAVQNAVDRLYARFHEDAPSWRQSRHQRKENPLLGLVCLFDAHFGRLTWGRETGADYDLKIAEAVWVNAVEDLLARSEGKRVERWLLPLGNDLIHIDGPDNKTRNGTPQDTDQRYPKILEVACKSAQYAVERLASSAPVDVLWVPGNHDLTTSWHCAHYLSAVFKTHDSVTVDYSPATRKYHSWEKVLLGFTHGNEEKITDLPGIMAKETKESWAKATVTDWYLGHVHHMRRWMTKDVGEQTGVTIRTLRTITPPDAWHAKRGYVGTVRAAEAHFYAPSHWDSCVSVVARED
jgi:predicted transcriptional regulator